MGLDLDKVFTVAARVGATSVGLTCAHMIYRWSDLLADQTNLKKEESLIKSFRYFMVAGAATVSVLALDVGIRGLSPR